MWTLLTGSREAVGLWGCDPAPSPVLGTLWLDGSTCAKHSRCIAESMARGNKRVCKGDCKLPPPPGHCFWVGRVDACTSRSSPVLAELFSSGAGSISKAERPWVWLPAGFCLAPGSTWGHAMA